MKGGHVVVVTEVPGTQKVETDRKGRVVRITADWNLACYCNRWQRTLRNVDGDTARAFAEAHESKEGE